MLQYEVGCIRVTHPCAGRQQKQASLLPLDLHVLGLPLAFILSQDQTLHCNVVVCFLAINSRIIDKVFCIPCFLNQYVKNLFLNFPFSRLGRQMYASSTELHNTLAIFLVKVYVLQKNASAFIKTGTAKIRQLNILTTFNLNFCLQIFAGEKPPFPIAVVAKLKRKNMPRFRSGCKCKCTFHTNKKLLTKKS